MLIDFTGKTAVVTGDAGDIGYVCTQTILESGTKVAIVDIDQEALNKAAASLCR